MASAIDGLLAEWSAQWPVALAVWSRFVQLHEPAWCFTEAEEADAQLSGSFAMIRLVDHAVVISLRQVVEKALQGFALEILAHEIGHHVYCPADLTDNARMLARMRVGLPTKEHLAPLIANLYSDLLINDRLQRTAELDMSGVYLRLGSECRDQLWTLYMRIYEILWKLPRGQLACGEIDSRLNQDAMLGARLVRSYSKDWLDGAGRFAALCLPYLLADEAARVQKLMSIWHDTRCAGHGAIPDGLTEIDEEELAGAIHPADDPDLSGVERSAEGDANTPREKAQQTGTKTAKNYRQPMEYAEVLKAAGANIDPAEVTARYYRERAIPHLVPFPVRKLPQATDPLPEGLDVWDVSAPLERIDWVGTLLNNPQIIPGVTTRQREYGTSPGADPETVPHDLYLGVDCSGSMGNPANHLSYPVLAGAIIALSALRAGARVKVVLSGEPGRTIATPGFERNAATVLKTLTSYLGTGTSFGIHRLSETFDASPNRAPSRPVHILIVSDNDMFSMLDSESARRRGWDVARRAVESAGGGGTFVLELPEAVRSTSWSQHTAGYLERIRATGWNVSIVSSMEELIEFARAFSRGQFGVRQRVADRSSA
jgi:hypothetical protein